MIGIHPSSAHISTCTPVYGDVHVVYVWLARHTLDVCWRARHISTMVAFCMKDAFWSVSFAYSLVKKSLLSYVWDVAIKRLFSVYVPLWRQNWDFVLLFDLLLWAGQKFESLAYGFAKTPMLVDFDSDWEDIEHVSLATMIRWLPDYT